MVTDPGLTANQERFHSGRVEGYTPVATPVKQFRGFERVALDLGQKTVTFTLGTGDLQLLDRDTHWLAVPGTFDIMIGKSLADIAMKGALEVKVSGGLGGLNKQYEPRKSRPLKSGDSWIRNRHLQKPVFFLTVPKGDA